MRRPLLFRRPRRIGCLCCIEPLRERIESGTQRLDVLLLPIHDIAQFDVGALQERNFGFDPLDGFAVHFDQCNHSVADAWQLRAARDNRNQTGGIPVSMASFAALLRKPDLAAEVAPNAYISSSAAQIKHRNPTSSVAPWRRVYLPRTGD